MLRLTSCIIIVTVLYSLIVADDPCRYENKEKGIIDLTSVGHTDGTAAFAKEVPIVESNYVFSYNPCKPFTDGKDCKDVAVCQISRNEALRFTLGTQNTTKWDPGAGAGTEPTISYSHNDKKVSVLLSCANNKTNELVAIGEGPINTYKFRLIHKCACWNGCKNSAGGDGRLHGGAIFIIVTVILLAGYFIGFALYFGIRHKYRGTDLIAHRTFWISTPMYARDGVRYVCRRLTGKGGLEYQNI